MENLYEIYSDLPITKIVQANNMKEAIKKMEKEYPEGRVQKAKFIVNLELVIS